MAFLGTRANEKIAAILMLVKPTPVPCHMLLDALAVGSNAACLDLNGVDRPAPF